VCVYDERKEGEESKLESEERGRREGKKRKK
jgi:hypothetical protein